MLKFAALKRILYQGLFFHFINLFGITYGFCNLCYTSVFTVLTIKLCNIFFTNCKYGCTWNE